MTHSLTKALLLAWLTATACAPEPSAGTKFLSVTLVLPRVSEGVFLNEPLTFFFSSELDRASVTSESISIRSPDGAAARGTLALNGSSLTFTPSAVLASDLSDGGYRPDTMYTVEIHGFPWVDGLRGTNGEPLRETHKYTFTTVSAAEPFETLLFADPEPEKTRLLGFSPPPAGAEHTIGSDDAIYLDSDKPIDPTSLRAADFVLRSNERGREPVPVRARLIENEAEARSRPKPRHVQSNDTEAAWERQPRAALIELTPVKKLPMNSLWRLALTRAEGVDATGPRDFSGHTLWNPGLQMWIHVGFGNRDAGKGVLHEDFQATVNSRPGAVPGADGLAHWSTNGRVEVRFPAAAGLGTDGHVELSGAVASDDVHAIKLDVKAGQRATLSPAEGLVVLRAQGTLRIAGQVTRDVVRGSSADGREVEPAIGLYTSDSALLHSITLTRWLERMREAKRNVTVLVAGGDLVIEADADLRANTPILLVAGGHVRVNGHARATRTGENGALVDSVFVLGDGGGPTAEHIQPRRENATLLEMDPPCEGNPLREVLHYAVMSGPLPKQGQVASWTSAEAGGSGLEKPGEGLGSKPAKNQNRWSVRYVRETTGFETSIDELGPVDRPQTLEPVGPIQILIDLWVAPGPTFEPPFVDFVRLTWEPGGAR